MGVAGRLWAVFALPDTMEAHKLVYSVKKRLGLGLYKYYPKSLCVCVNIGTVPRSSSNIIMLEPMICS